MQHRFIPSPLTRSLARSVLSVARTFLSLSPVMYTLLSLQHFSFYDLIVTKARGKSGPLFHFDVHDDIRIVHDTRIEKDESHPGKVRPPHGENRGTRKRRLMRIMRLKRGVCATLAGFRAMPHVLEIRALKRRHLQSGIFPFGGFV